MKQIFSAGIVVFYEEGQKREYLLLQHGAGHWDFPKGKIEEGESQEQAALRELQEETGLSCVIIPELNDSISYWFTFSDNPALIHKTVYFFVGQVFDQKVTLSHEHVGYRWLAYERAVEQITYDHSKELLKKVELFLNNKR